MKFISACLAAGLLAIASTAVKAENGFYPVLETSSFATKPILVSLFQPLAEAHPAVPAVNESGISNNHLLASLDATSGKRASTLITGSYHCSRRGDLTTAPNPLGFFCIGLLGLIGLMQIRRSRY